MKRTLLLSCLLLALPATLSLVSCEKSPSEQTNSNPSPQSSDSVAESTKVSTSLAGKLSVLKGDNFQSTGLASEIDYYIVYYSASW